MVNEPRLFDPPETIAAARDEALERVDQNADQEWKTAAREEIEFAAGLGSEFTSEDISTRIEFMFGVETHDRRALGPLFQAAAKAGKIRRVGYAPSRLARRHGGPVAVWVGVGQPEGSVASAWRVEDDKR